MREQNLAYEAVHFSLQHVEQLRYEHLNPVSQTRKKYDHEDHEELQRAIEARNEHGELRNELFHPLMVNRLGPSEAEEYLTDLNLCHGTSHTIEELTQGEDGSYLIIIAGHRRHRAIGSIAAEHEYQRVTVACSVFENLSFRDALRKQIDENTHQQLSVIETARAIQASYRFGLAKGDYTSVADCIRDLPFGENKVRSALKFCELPEKIQDLVEEEHLSYGVAVALYPIMSTLRWVHSDLSEDEVIIIIQDRMLEYGLKAINNNWSRSRAAKYVDEYIRLHARQGSFDLELNLENAVQLARRARQRETNQLISGGLSRLRAFAALSRTHTDLPHEQREAIVQELHETLNLLGHTATAGLVVESLLFEDFAGS